MVVCDLGNPMKGGTKVSDHMTPSGQTTSSASCFESRFLTPSLLPLSDWLLASPCRAAIGQVLAELRFSVHQLSEEDTTVKFDLQIVR